MEAFDQPWKAYQEGSPGSYWGVYDVNRAPKFAFSAAIVRFPEWHALAAISVAAAVLILAVLYLNSTTLRNRGRGFLAVVVYAAATIAVWVVPRLHPAIHDGAERRVRCAAVAGNARGDPGAAGRSPRVGRGALGDFAPPAAATRVLADGGPQPQGLDPCPGIQRAARDAHRDPGCARAPGLCQLRSARDRQQHGRRERLAAGRGALRASRRALPVLPRRAAVRLQGRRAQLRPAAHRRGRAPSSP